MAQVGPHSNSKRHDRDQPHPLEEDGSMNDATTMPTREVHAWLHIIVQTRFFTKCQVHPDVKKSGCNNFCLRCQGPAVCNKCMCMAHVGHPMLMMKMVSRQMAVGTKNLKNLVPDLVLDDVAQEFKFNHNDHIFLTTTKYKDGEVMKGHESTFCHTACRTKTKYCSINCKLAREGLNAFGSSLAVPKPERVLRQTIISNDFVLPNVNNLTNNGGEKQVARRKVRLPKLKDCSSEGKSGLQRGTMPTKYEMSSSSRGILCRYLWCRSSI